MDIRPFAQLRDRRIAASEEYIATRGPSSRIYRGLADRPGGVRALTRSGPRWDRPASQIHTIVLHHTAGSTFLTGRAARALVDPVDDLVAAHDSRLDRVAAHFVVRNDGAVFYTHDVQYVIDSAAGRFGIDIEFAGDYSPTGIRLEPDAIRAARALLRSLKLSIPTIDHIHPHGQVQTVDFDRVGPLDPATGRRARVRRVCGGPSHTNVCAKLNTCPGPDIWVNVGMWACRPVSQHGLGLISSTVRAPYPNNTITPTMADTSFDQHIP